MITTVSLFRAQRTLVALAACAVCIAAQAQSANVATIISVGVGGVGGSNADRAQFGQYTGLDSKSLVGMLGIDYSLRNPEAGQWVDFKGSSLLGETREMNLVWKNPGSWKFTADYGEMVRVDPNTLNTTLLGAGTITPVLAALTPAALPPVDVELKTKRTGLGLGFTKYISPALQFQLDLKSENKEGSHAFSLAYICPALRGSVCNSMFPEPINANHSQLEARASYAMERLRFTVGYYGSYYTNHNAALTAGGFGINGSLNQMALALPPDNQAHQLDLSGSYDFTRTTRGTFKLGWATALQNADFSNAGLEGPQLSVQTDPVTKNPIRTVLNSAGAKINTTFAKVGITSRPSSQLSLLGDLRYEDKNDQTPIYYYNLLGQNYGADIYSTNRDLPNKKVQGKLQANWQFNSEYRGTLGADYEFIDRGTYTATSPVVGISALRQKTDEAGVRAELRRQLADNVSGTISLSSSHRGGSNWWQPASGLLATGVTQMANPAPASVFMPTLADRQRNKVKLLADWQANDKLGLQFSAERGADNFSAATANGLRNNRMSQLGVDGSYVVSDNLAITGYLSRSTQTLNQSVYAGSVMAFDNHNLAASFGVTGKPSDKVQVGASLTCTDDRSAYAQSPDAAALPAVASQLALAGGLPDINYRQTALKLFATYALEKKSSVRVDLVHQRNRVNDWTWGANGVPFTYSDGATMTQSPNQKVSFVGVTYVYQLP